MVQNLLLIMEIISMYKLLIAFLTICIFASPSHAGYIGDPDGDILDIENGHMPTLWQDPKEPTIIIHASKAHKFTTSTADLSMNDKVVNVTDASTCIAGDSLKVITPSAGRFYAGHIVSVSTNDITVDSPFDFAHPSGASVVCAKENMAVDGSSTPQIFSLRAADPNGKVPITVHVTRVILTGICTSATSLDKFGNITALTHGLMFRRRNNGTSFNIFNIKNGSDLEGLGYDYRATIATQPQDNVDGFIARITFAGPSKMGTVLEVGPNQDLEWWVQDNLASGPNDITSLVVTFEGHVKLP